MVQQLNKRVRGGNVVIKVDMEKAYDSIDWVFVLHVRTCFGFSPGVCGLVKQCITTSWFSVVMNGTAKGFFS